MFVEHHSHCHTHPGSLPPPRPCRATISINVFMTSIWWLCPSRLLRLCRLDLLSLLRLQDLRLNIKISSGMR